MGKKIIDAKKNSNGLIEAVRFQGNASFTPVKAAIKMADRGEINNAHSVHPRQGNLYLRTNPDNKQKNNLKEMAK